MKKYKDIIIGAFLFAVGLVYFIMSFSIKLTYIDQIVGSRLFPQICGTVFMGLSLWLAVTGVIRLWQSRSNRKWGTGAEMDAEGTSGGMGDRESEPHEPHIVSPVVKTLLVLVSFAVFCWLLDKIGFVMDAFLYLFSQMLLIAGRKLSVKDIVFYFALSMVLSAGIYYLFDKGFSLMLPKAGWF